jgi:hypothetical protein
VSVCARLLSYSELGQEAEAFLNRFHPSRTVPTPIEEIVELRMRLEIIPWRDLRSITGVDAFVTRDCSMLYVDAEDYTRDLPYLKFTFAEEAAHVWLHGELLRSERISTDADWLLLRRAVKSDSRFELQAKDLAGLILVPPKALESACGRICQDAREALHESGQISNDVMRRVVMEQLCELFKVSARVIEIRMNYDRLWGITALTIAQHRGGYQAKRLQR